MAKYSQWSAVLVNAFGFQLRVPLSYRGDSIKDRAGWALLWMNPAGYEQLDQWIKELPRHADYTGDQTPPPGKPKLLPVGTKVVAKGYNVQNFDYPAYGKIVAVCAGGSHYLVTFYGYCINGKHEESTHGLYCAANQVEAI